jgi:hypothetical protein
VESVYAVDVKVVDSTVDRKGGSVSVRLSRTAR